MKRVSHRLLLLDIGNTSVTYGVYQEDRLVRFGKATYNNIPLIIKKCSKNGRKNIPISLVISSVVPKITRKIIKIVKQKRHISLWVVGQNLPVPLKSHYRPPSRLGIDRAVNLYGALQMYSPPLVVLDFGTALTVDYISAKGVFEGGMIIPGPEIAFQALLQRAALLPKNLRLPSKRSRFWGQTTYECLATGVLEGFSALTDGLIRRLKKRYGNKLEVIATGGGIRHLRPFTDTSLYKYDPLHSLKSLVLLYWAHKPYLM